ncbi:hypothetical protein [Bacillus ndiopicus]|uniref:hypothetical protein n=1 Tax=Bacillus ndiopicus TaxID=1347368 RepID=UPI0005A82B46|nr:hypothetical protein [Bacillus ndiopicus]
MIISLVPILIFIFIIFVIVNGLGRLPLRFKTLFTKRFYQLLAVYILIGLIATFAFPYLPNAQKALLSEKEIKKKLDESQYLEQLVLKKRFAEIDPAYLKEERTFTVPTEELIVKTNLDYPATRIIVTWRDDATSNDIYASYYEFPFIFSGIDVTDQVVIPEISFKSNILSLFEREGQATYRRIVPEISLFGGYYSMHSTDEKYYNYVMGQQMLHLNVPKHINIIDNSGMIQYIYY